MKVLLIVGIVLVIGGVIFLAWFLAKKRREAFAAIAETLGLAFQGKGAALDEPGFEIFEKGTYKTTAKNLLSGSYRGCDVRIADYSYTSRSRSHRSDGSRKTSTSTRTQTVFVLKHATMAIPQFSIRKQGGLFGFVSNLVGMQDIEFPNDEQFSDAFIVRGGNEAATRGALGDHARIELLRHQGTDIVLEGAGNTLVLHFGESTKVDETKRHLDALVDLAEALETDRAAGGHGAASAELTAT